MQLAVSNSFILYLNVIILSFMNLFFLPSLQILLGFLEIVSCVISAILFFIPSHIASPVSHKCKYLTQFKSVYLFSSLNFISVLVPSGGNFALNCFSCSCRSVQGY